MPKNDLDLLHTLILAHGLQEVLLGLSAVCSSMSLDIAPTDAHSANEWMHRSVALDGIAVELEFPEIN